MKVGLILFILLVVTVIIAAAVIISTRPQRVAVRQEREADQKEQEDTELKNQQVQRAATLRDLLRDIYSWRHGLSLTQDIADALIYQFGSSDSPESDYNPADPWHVSARITNFETILTRILHLRTEQVLELPYEIDQRVDEYLKTYRG